MALGAGSLVIIGGALDPSNQRIYDSIWERRVDGQPICVISTASATPQDSMRAYRQDFESFYGQGAARGLLVTAGDLETTQSPELVDKLKSCGGFFFTGGDQSRIIDTFFPGGVESPAAKAILAAHLAGAVIAGTSAGAAMMSDPMIGGGSSERALSFGVCDSDGCPGLWLRNGFGLLPGFLVDQHFVERGRVGRLSVGLLSNERGIRRGLGVGENTAVVLDGSSASVVGSGAAVLVDARRAKQEPQLGRWEPIFVEYLGEGSRFRLDTSDLEEEPKRRVDAPCSMLASLEGSSFFDQLLEETAARDSCFRWSGQGWKMEATARRSDSAGGVSYGHITLSLTFGEATPSERDRE